MSVYDNSVNSGAEQFFLTITAAGPPAVVTITFARLSDGETFPGISGYTAQNSIATSWTNGVLNYVWYRLSRGGIGPYFGIESDVGGFPDEPDVVPLWILDINGAGVVNSILDARPWFDGGAGGGTNSIEERLKEILQHSVMEDALFDAFTSTDNLDGNSTGAFLSPNRYELDPGEYFYTNFAAAPPEHLALINQPYVAVLTDQIIDETTDIEVWVSRVAAPGNPFPGPNANWVQAPANFSLVDLVGAPGADVLNIAVRNIGASTYEVVGWGIYSNPTTAPGGVIVPKSGLHVGGTGLDVYNTNSSAFNLSASNFEFSWDEGTDTLSWDTFSGGTPDDLVIEITDDVLGTVDRTLSSPSSLGGVIAGSYVYFDVDRDDPPGTAVTLQVSAGPPVMNKDRFILGRRMPDPNAVADTFALWAEPIILGGPVANGVLLDHIAGNPFPSLVRQIPVGTKYIIIHAHQVTVPSDGGSGNAIIDVVNGTLSKTYDDGVGISISSTGGVGGDIAYNSGVVNTVSIGAYTPPVGLSPGSITITSTSSGGLGGSAAVTLWMFS
jgi:hypothetical protein